MKIQEHFRKILNTYYSCIFGQIALTSEEYSENAKKGSTLRIGTSFKKDVWLSRGSFIEKLTDELYDDDIADLEIDYNNMILNTFSISAYEVLSNWENFKNIEEEPPVVFLKHIRNASVNQNIFILDKEILPNSIIWRDKKLTIRRNRKDCFVRFMGYGDLVVLFEDIYKILIKNIGDEYIKVDKYLKAYFYNGSDKNTVSVEFI